VGAIATGSTSTYTTRASGSDCWATSCTLPWVGMPDPMSRNCLTPAAEASRTARPRKARLAWPIARALGSTAVIARPTSWSARKLWLPPNR
jgi:hypothetical protein